MELMSALKGQNESLDEVEKVLLSLPQEPCPVIHRFGPGLYIREVNLPAETFVIGHRHKFETLNVFLKGRLTMLKDDGTTVELTAPMIFTSPPGRKVGYISEDVVWLNIFATEETDVEKLEAHYIDKSQSFKDSEALQTLASLMSGQSKEKGSL